MPSKQIRYCCPVFVIHDSHPSSLTHASPRQPTPAHASLGLPQYDLHMLHTGQAPALGRCLPPIEKEPS